MNRFLILLWCNLAVVLSASTNYQPRGLSVRDSGSLVQTSYGTRNLKRRQLSDASRSNRLSSTNDLSPTNHAADEQEPQTPDAPRNHGTSERFDQAGAALKAHFAQMKKSMKRLQKSSTGHNAKAELEQVFTNAKQGMLIVKAHSAELSSLTGVDQQELDAFFADLAKSIYDLHRALKKSDHKLEDAKAFFAHLVKNVSNLKTSSKDSQAKSEQVQTFFTNLIDMISNLEASLETEILKPGQASAEVKTFFLELGESVTNLEVAMEKQGTESNQYN